VQRAGVLANECGARRVLPLKVSAAFHSPLMEQAARRMQEALAQVQIGDPRVPLIANVTATPVEHAEEVRRELAAQVMAPVCWVASVHLLVAQGVSTFVEIGPGNVLTGLIKRAAPGAELINVRDVDEAAAYAARQG
jgi:[acyl-carrier-protein] S-malonyltransferase